MLESLEQPNIEVLGKDVSAFILIARNSLRTKEAHGPMDDAEMERLIAEAFADVAYPGDDSIMRSRNWEAEEYLPDFRGKHWREIIDPDFLKSHTSLSVLSSRALQFYMPAYLIGGVRYPATAKEWTIRLCQLLYPYSDPSWPLEWKQQEWQDLNDLMKLLTVKQKQSIRQFLEYLVLKGTDEWWIPTPPGNLPELMLANYWSQF